MNKKDHDEFDKAMKESVKLGLTKRTVKNGEVFFQLTAKGKKWVESTYPKTVARQKVANTSLEECIASAEMEESEPLVKELEQAVKDGFLVKLLNPNTRQISWLDSRMKKNMKSGEIVLAGKFK